MTGGESATTADNGVGAEAPTAASSSFGEGGESDNGGRLRELPVWSLRRHREHLLMFGASAATELAECEADFEWAQIVFNDPWGHTLENAFDVRLALAKESSAWVRLKWLEFLWFCLPTGGKPCLYVEKIWSTEADVRGGPTEADVNLEETWPTSAETWPIENRRLFLAETWATEADVNLGCEWSACLDEAWKMVEDARTNEGRFGGSARWERIYYENRRHEIRADPRYPTFFRVLPVPAGAARHVQHEIPFV